MKIVLLVLIIFSTDKLYAKETEDFSNNALRMYGSIGSGIPVFNAGAGLSYVYEFGNLGKKRDVFFGFSTDAQVGGYGSSFFPWVIFNLQASISVGKRYQNGSRFSYDIIGSGFGLVYDYGDNRLIDSWYENNPFNYVLNFFSFHYTSNNGFYFSWRNNLMLPVLEYRSYFTIGFDFSKSINILDGEYFY